MIALDQTSQVSYRFLEILEDDLEDETRGDLANRLRTALHDFPALSGETVEPEHSHETYARVTDEQHHRNSAGGQQ